jgi:sugar phosphate isomerase/epimerase
MNPEQDILIGTLVGAKNASDYIRQILPHGFESFSLTFWNTIGGVNLEREAGRVKEVLAGSGAVISSLAVYGNPLEHNPDAVEARRSWELLIDNVHLFDADVVAGFTGRLLDQPIKECIPRFKEVFETLAKHAADKGVRIAFENCPASETAIGRTSSVCCAWAVSKARLISKAGTTRCTRIRWR